LSDLVETTNNKDAPASCDVCGCNPCETPGFCRASREADREAIRRAHEFLGRFVVFPSKEAHIAVTLWAMHTHLIDRWETTPRLAFLSAEPASGKTRALEILELLTPNAVSAVNASPAYLFRRAASDELPTILFDEIDAVFGPKAKENEELRAFINAGHRRGAVAGRCVVRGATVFTEELPAYCAVALAGLGWLPDTILSRSIIVRMRRRRADERVEPYRRRQHATEGEYIRHEIERWAKSQPAELSKWPDMPAGIEDRAADVWEALLAVADAVGGEWPERARKAAVALVADGKDTEPSLGIRLLADIRQVFDADTLPSKVLLQKLHDLEEAPWRDLKGKPLDERGISHRLRQFGIKSKVIRVGGATPRGYSKTDFFDAWGRYVPDVAHVAQQATSPPPQPSPCPEKSATSATPATALKSNGFFVADKPDVADTERNVAATKRDVAAVALVADFPGDGRETCAQCGAGRPDDPPTAAVTAKNGQTVYVHERGCLRFWEKDHGNGACS
jgi:hypothetical protein